MEGFKEITLPSGKILSVASAPFKDSRKLYQAIGGELLRINPSEEEQMTTTIKNVICIGFSSLEIERALEPCLKRCLYNGSKILDTTFEPVEAREDYLDICVEVVKENVRPFTKSLFAQFKAYTEVVSKVLQSQSSKIQRGSSTTSNSATETTVSSLESAS